MFGSGSYRTTEYGHLLTVEVMQYKQTYHSRMTSIQSVEVFKRNSWSVGIRGEGMRS